MKQCPVSKKNKTKNKNTKNSRWRQNREQGGQFGTEGPKGILKMVCKHAFVCIEAGHLGNLYLKSSIFLNETES